MEILLSIITTSECSSTPSPFSIHTSYTYTGTKPGPRAMPGRAGIWAAAGGVGGVGVVEGGSGKGSP